MYGDSLPIMNHVVSNRFPQTNLYSHQTPTSQRLTLENQYPTMLQQMSPQSHLQSNPYSDYIEVFNTCSNLVQHKIQGDQRYQEIYNQCQSVLLQETFSQVMPTVLSTQHGRILFERLYTTTQILKNEYTQQEIQKEKQLEDREKAAEQEKQQIEAQKQEIAIMLAQIKEIQQTLPNQSIAPTHQKTLPNLTDAIISTQNHSNNQSSQQNQYRKSNKQQNSGGDSE